MSDAASETKRQRYQVCVVPALFCAMQNINDRRYLLGEKNRMKTRTLKAEEANVKPGAAAVKFRKDYKEQQSLQVAALRYIKVCQVLFVSYI